MFYICLLLALPTQCAEQGPCNGTVSICLSVPCTIVCSLFAAVGPVARRYQLIAARLAPQQHGAAHAQQLLQGSASFTADVGS